MQRTTLTLWFVASCVFVFIMACSSASPQREYTTELVFRAKVADLALEHNTLARDKHPEEVVTVVVPGRIFTPPRLVTPMTKEGRHRRSPAQASRSDFSANKADDIEWIVDNFARKEQPEIRHYLTDAAMRKRHQLLFAALATKRLYGVCAYADYRLILVCLDGQHHFCSVETYLQEDAEWKRTNQLIHDPVFDVIFTAFQSPASRQQIRQRVRAR
jgi:hypothetical protein